MSSSTTPHKWASVIKAWADRTAIQYRYFGTGEWVDCVSYTVPNFDDAGLEWRIKPERWYRVALMVDVDGEWTVKVDAEWEEEVLTEYDSFKGWLTERIYY